MREEVVGARHMKRDGRMNALGGRHSRHVLQQLLHFGTQLGNGGGHIGGQRDQVNVFGQSTQVFLPRAVHRVQILQLHLQLRDALDEQLFGRNV